MSGNCHKDDGAAGHQASGETPMHKRAGPSKGKGRVPLDACERWLRECSSSQTPSDSGEEMTAIMQVNAVAERLLDLQVAL